MNNKIKVLIGDDSAESGVSVAFMHIHAERTAMLYLSQ